MGTNHAIGTEPMTSQRLGKRNAVGTGLSTGRTPVSPKTCRDLHLERGVVRLWSSRGRSDRNARVCASCADLIPSSFHRWLFLLGGAAAGGRKRCAAVNRAASNHPLRCCCVSDGEITSRKHGNEYTTAN